MRKRGQEHAPIAGHRSEEEILSESNPTLIVPGLEGPQIIFDRAELGRRVLSSIETLGLETVSDATLGSDEVLLTPEPGETQPRYFIRDFEGASPVYDRSVMGERVRSLLQRRRKESES